MNGNRCVTSFALIVLSAAPCFAQGDLARLQGTWWTRTQAPTLARTKNAKPVYTTTVLVIQGNVSKMILQTPDGKAQEFQSEFVLDESASPKRFDDAKESILGKTLAIYELSGDTLRICSAGPGKPRPTEFVGSSNGLPRLVTYNKGTPPGGMPTAGRGERPRSRFPSQFKARATVVEVDKHRNVLIRFDDSRELLVKSDIGSAYDTSGQKVKDGHAIMKAGNVLDVFLTGKADKDGENYHFIDARLVSGSLVVKTEKAAVPLDLKSGVVTNVASNHATIEIDGVAVHVSRHSPSAHVFDANGVELPKGSAERIFKVGNKVQVFVNKKASKAPYPTVREIHLVEGALADEGGK